MDYIVLSLPKRCVESKEKEEKDTASKKDKKAAKKKKEGPKKPLSAYMLYNNHRRAILSSEHADKKVTEISKMVGEEWRKMTE